MRGTFPTRVGDVSMHLGLCCVCVKLLCLLDLCKMPNKHTFTSVRILNIVWRVFFVAEMTPSWHLLPVTCRLVGSLHSVKVLQSRGQ